MTVRQTEPWRRAGADTPAGDNAVALAYSCAIILREQRSKLRGNGHGLDNADAYRNLHRARDQRVSPGRVLIRKPLADRIGANYALTPTLSLPLSGGGKSEPLVRSFGLPARACPALHLFLNF